MPTSSNGQRPFTQHLRDLRDVAGLRYQDLADGSKGCRSTAWFHKLLNNDDPWVVSPPGPDDWEPLAKLVGRDAQEVREFIAEEWFGIVPSEETARVRGLAQQIDALQEHDFRLVKQLLTRLAVPKSSPQPR